MKNQIKGSLSLMAGIVLSISLALTACKKAEKGPAGANGTNGKNGNANVIGTGTISVPTSSWVAGGSSMTAIIPVPEITQDIVTKGSVTVFINYGAEWYGLPDINGINSTQYGFSLGKVILYNTNSNGTMPGAPSTHTYRIVVISASNRELYPTLNWHNYKEVKAALHLKD